MRLAVPGGLERGGEATEAGELLLQVVPVDDLRRVGPLDLAARQEHPAVPLLLRRGRGRGRGSRDVKVRCSGRRRGRVLHRGGSCPRVRDRGKARARHRRAEVQGGCGLVVGFGEREREREMRRRFLLRRAAATAFGVVWLGLAWLGLAFPALGESSSLVGRGGPCPSRSRLEFLLDSTEAGLRPIVLFGPVLSLGCA